MLFEASANFSCISPFSSFGLEVEDAARSLSEIFVKIAVLVVRLFSVTRMISVLMSSVTESSFPVAWALLVWLFLNVPKLQYSLPRSCGQILDFVFRL
jgi:hypothetical protein